MELNRFQKRAVLISKLHEDVKGQLIAKRVCKNDPIFFINNFCWTFDPRKTPSKIPFELYDFQKTDIVNNIKYALDNKEPLHIVKSRDMGLSWVLAAFFAWCLLFKEGFAGTIGSRKESEVDDQTLHSFIPKIAFIIEKLPYWMRGAFDKKKNRSYMKISHPDTGSFIRGEGGDNMGRGGRSTLFFADEFAFVPRSSTVMEAISQNTDVPIFGSTPNGKGNEFARIYFDKKVKSVSIPYSKHPHKDEVWFKKQQVLMTEEQIAQELLCSFTKSVKGRVFPQFDYEKHTKFNTYSPDHLIELCFDFGIGDPTSVGFFQRINGTPRMVDFVEVGQTPELKAGSTFKKVMQHIMTMGQKIDGKFYKYKYAREVYGDPDGAKRDRLSGHSAFGFLRSEYGFISKTKRELIKNGIESCRNVFDEDRIIIDRERCRYFIDALENHKFPDSETSSNDKPIHDWTSHSCSMFRYYIDYHYPMKPKASISIGSYS